MIQKIKKINIFMVIYNKCGYYDYIWKKFVLDLEKIIK